MLHSWITLKRRSEAKCNNIRLTYQCEKCLKNFSRRDHLRTHEKNIHGEDAGPFVCVICSQLYKNTESLRKHISKFHFPKINDIHSKVEVKPAEINGKHISKFHFPLNAAKSEVKMDIEGVANATHYSQCPVPLDQV